ncbi:hypothetical protein CsNV_035 [Callinectes sapidus nudivirus]|nr:hypothetical protein CsNV_035 [Callinectes sapidus nudivirus]
MSSKKISNDNSSEHESEDFHNEELVNAESNKRKREDSSNHNKKRVKIQSDTGVVGYDCIENNSEKHNKSKNKKDIKNRNEGESSGNKKRKLTNSSNISTSGIASTRSTSTSSSPSSSSITKTSSISRNRSAKHDTEQNTESERYKAFDSINPTNIINIQYLKNAQVMGHHGSSVLKLKPMTSEISSDTMENEIGENLQRVKLPTVSFVDYEYSSEIVKIKKSQIKF